MGHTSKSKFTFPLPGRKSKPAQPPPPVAGPISKAQKILGTAQISVDSKHLSPQSKWPWDTRSNSGISIAVSETTASQTDAGETGLGILHEGEVASPSSRREIRWEEESAIIPKGFGRQSVAMADTTDASSLRRRQSSSTIASFYDKSKQPLSISQQTSNSAMAKGVPAKAHAMLDMGGTVPGPKEKKKPSRLDLSSLLPKSITQRHLRPDVDRGHVLGPDMFTKSPSMMSISPGGTPPPIKQRTDRFPRKKKTIESLREAQPGSCSPKEQQQMRRPGTSPNPATHRPSKSSVNLYNLYDHYEQRSFADAMGKDMDEIPSENLQVDKNIAAYPPPTAALPPLPTSAQRAQNHTKQAPEMPLSAALSPLSLMSAPADSASISSRHTRTSKASRRTDRSLTDLDLQQNSVLSLSSDSEEDSYEPSYKSSLAVPPTSDGQASPTSPRSAMSQRTTASQESSRSKPPKRTSFAASPQFLPIPEGSSPSQPLKINTRLSSLAQNPTLRLIPNKPRPDPRMSVASTLTSKTLTFGVAASDHPQGPKILSMIRRNSPPNLPPNQPTWTPSSDGNDFENFPAPPSYGAHRPSISGTSDNVATPISPTSVDFYLQSHHHSLAGFDSGSVHSGKSSGSATKNGNGRRGSAASSMNDAGSGRFMAVTKQEEMLLAALRMKRARMREDIIAEFEEELDRDEHHLDRHVTNDSSASSSRISRQSSASTMRTYETGTLNMRPQHHQQQQQPQIRISAGSTENMKAKSVQGRPMAPLMLDDAMYAEPTPDLNDFIDFDNESLALPLQRHSVVGEPAQDTKSRSRSSSKSGSRSSSSKGARSSTSAVQSSKQSQPWMLQQDLESLSPKSVPVATGHRGFRNSDLQSQILEEDVDEDEETGVPRPDSPISPAAFPIPMASLTRKKQVRLSAVGNYHQNNSSIEAGWWDDSG